MQVPGRSPAWQAWQSTKPFCHYTKPQSKIIDKQDIMLSLQNSGWFPCNFIWARISSHNNHNPPISWKSNLVLEIDTIKAFRRLSDIRQTSHCWVTMKWVKMYQSSNQSNYMYITNPLTTSSLSAIMVIDEHKQRHKFYRSTARNSVDFAPSTP